MYRKSIDLGIIQKKLLPILLWGTVFVGIPDVPSSHALSIEDFIAILKSRKLCTRVELGDEDCIFLPSLIHRVLPSVAISHKVASVIHESDKIQPISPFQIAALLLRCSTFLEEHKESIKDIHRLFI